MKRVGERLVYSPSDLIRFMESPFASFMERLHLEHPDRATPDEWGEEDELLFRKGLEHEERFLARLRAEGRDVCAIESGRGAKAATARALADRREVIYQAALEGFGFEGFADFVVRDAETDAWEVWDTKLSKKARPYFLVQLCSYAEMLHEATGEFPRIVRVVTGDDAVRSFRVEDYLHYTRGLRAAFLAQMEAFRPDEPPFPAPNSRHGQWESHAARILEDCDHVSRVANIRQSQIRKLAAAGVTTLAGLAECAFDRIPRLDDEIYERLRDQARLQLASAGRERPEHRVLAPDPEDPRRGLAALPPPSPGDVYFDMEGYPLVSGGLEYLFGAVTAGPNGPEFHDFWAHDRASEKRAFAAFVDFVVARRRADPRMHVYHYAAYETSALRRLMGRHASRETEVDQLLRDEVFVDLYRVVREGVRVGEPAYSIKNLERLYRGKREGGVTSAGGSIVAYEKWLVSGEPPDWRESPLLAAIRDYNRDDCESLLDLTAWLRARAAESGIAYVPRRDEAEEGEPDDEPSLPRDVVERRRLAEELLAEIPEDPAVRAADPERWRVHELLAHLLEFHRREAKPVFWAMYDRRDMTPEELCEDLGCLAGLVREAPDPTPIRRSKGWWYRFDPEQDTRIGKGSKVRFAHDLDLKAEIEEMEAGRVLVRFGPSKVKLLPAGRPPARVDLIPEEFVAADVIEAAIESIVRDYQETGTLPAAIADLLHRRPPRIAGHAGGPLLRPGEDPTEGTVRIVAGLDRSTLVVQGPPGAGKTWTASHAIAALLGAGKSVGITSNSHKAIHNLLDAVGERMGPEFEAMKVGGPGPGVDELYDRWPGIRYFGSSRTAAEIFVCGLVAGTAWFFARPEMAGCVDVLFVDEAGQVSLANLVGAARAAKNIVLLGDQMQLAQPVMGAHPGESGESALDYLLGDRATVPDDFGVFLGTTWRMHPELCRFVSAAFYEDRLHPVDKAAARVLDVPPDARLVRQAAGILFLPVEHEGNTQGSDEEVDRIAEIVRELLGRRWTPGPGEKPRPLTIEDLLVVAPYNLQVKRLARALPEGARVGTVDRFQGQEAPVVILSLCQSATEAAPRGMDFLLSRNRVNVALSRAMTIAIVVGDPRLANAPVATVEEMARQNLLCRLTTLPLGP